MCQGKTHHHFAAARLRAARTSWTKRSTVSGETDSSTRKERSGDETSQKSTFKERLSASASTELISLNGAALNTVPFRKVENNTKRELVTEHQSVGVVKVGFQAVWNVRT